MAYTFDANAFLAAYPEFAELGQVLITAQADLALCEVNSYCGLPSAKQNCANWLYIAHNLKLRERQLDACGGNIVSSVKSKNDQETYKVTDDLAGYSLNSTTYGVRLQMLLKKCRFGIRSFSSGCSTGSYYG